MKVIDPVYFWKITLILTLGTFLIRGSFVFLSKYLYLSDRGREVLSFIPAAILPAMTLPSVYFHQGQLETVMGKERLLILILSVVFCYLTKSMIFTISFGLILLYLTTHLF